MFRSIDQESHFTVSKNSQIEKSQWAEKYADFEECFWMTTKKDPSFRSKPEFLALTDARSLSKIWRSTLQSVVNMFKSISHRYILGDARTGERQKFHQ